MSKDTLIARWETRGKKYWYELYTDGNGFYYKGYKCGGNLGNMSKTAAIQFLEKRMDEAGRIDGIHYKGVYLNLIPLKTSRTRVNFIARR